jgi:hypothetical protein
MTTSLKLSLLALFNLMIGNLFAPKTISTDGGEKKIERLNHGR